MMTPVLKVENLSVEVEGKLVLQEIGLKLAVGEVVALMGANGSGKSSLANTFMGNSRYVVKNGEIIFDGKDLLAMTVDERARAKLYVAWQNPVAIPGVSVLSYLRVIYEAKGTKIKSLVEFRDHIQELVKRVGLTKEVLSRGVNEGFSGGEKKRFELLQLLLLQPKLAILDEIDSGLDVDGLRLVGEVLQEMSKKGTAFFLITHYKRLLDYVVAKRAIVLSQGKIVASGGHELIERIEREGYAKLN